MIFPAWYLSLALEVALVLRVMRWQAGRLPWFLAFLAYDSVRWLGLALIDSQFPGTGWFAQAWKYSEPIGVILLVIAAMETVAVISEWMAVGLIIATLGLLVPTFSGPHPFFWGRLISLSLAAAWIIFVLVAKLDDRIDDCIATLKRYRHALLMAWLLVSDVICYYAIVTGAKDDPRPGLFLVIAQSLSLLGWLFWTKDLRT